MSGCRHCHMVNFTEWFWNETEHSGIDGKIKYTFWGATEFIRTEYAFQRNCEKDIVIVTL